MKPILFTCLLMVTAIQMVFSQDIWIRPNAVWHYGFVEPALSDGFIKIRYTADTVIDNHSCQKLEATRYRFLRTGPNPEQVMMDSSSFGKWFTYLNGDTVFYRNNNQFYVLYNFAAEIDDEWTMETGTSWFNCDDTSAVSVTDTGTMVIQNETMRYIHLEATDSSTLGINARVAARIGTIGQDFLFPTGRNCDPDLIVDFTMYHFLCYEDDAISYNPGGGYCEWYLGIEEQQALKIGISPNPANDLLAVTVADAVNTYRILSVTGQQIASGVLQFQEGTINIADLASGVYYLCITDQQGLQGISKFVKA